MIWRLSRLKLALLSTGICSALVPSYATASTTDVPPPHTFLQTNLSLLSALQEQDSSDHIASSSASYGSINRNVLSASTSLILRPGDEKVERNFEGSYELQVNGGSLQADTINLQEDSNFEQWGGTVKASRFNLTLTGSNSYRFFYGSFSANNINITGQQGSEVSASNPITLTMMDGQTKALNFDKLSISNLHSSDSLTALTTNNNVDIKPITVERSLIEIHNISSSGGIVNGMSSPNWGSISKTTDIYIHDLTSQAQACVGFSGAPASTTRIGGNVEISSLSNTGEYNRPEEQLEPLNYDIPKGSVYGVFGYGLAFNGGLQIRDLMAAEGGDNFAVIAVGLDPINGQDMSESVHSISINGGSQVINQIDGNMFAHGNGISAEFTNTASYFNGSANMTDAKGSDIELYFSDNGKWIVTDKSSISGLEICDNGIVDLTGTSSTGKNHSIKTQALRAQNGQVHLHMDLLNQEDRSYIESAYGLGSESVVGNIQVVLDIENFDKVQNSFKQSDVPFIYLSHQTEINKYLENEGYEQRYQLTVSDLKFKPGAAKKFELVFVPDEGAEGSDNQEGKVNGGWYLVNPNPSVDPKPNPDKPNPDKPTPDQGGQTKPPVTDEVDQVLSLGTSLTQAVGMLSETEDLRMRMGDVRHGDTDGLWVRTYSRKDTARGSFGNGFEQDVHGFHIGADHVIHSNDNASWLFGGAFHYGKSDIEGSAEAGGGDADIDQYTFKAYATYMKDNGAFADIVLHTGYYDTTLTGKDNTGLGSFKGDYSNWGYGVSAEVGHRFDLSHIANSWYVEPTAQLTWFHAEGKNFETSTGLEINQGDADFITGRLGATVGKVFALGETNDPMSSYFSVAMKGGMLYQFDGDQTITAHGTDGATVVCADAMDMKGARAYYGITADWKIDDTWRVYGQISREEGSGYTKDYDASIGVRYAF